MCVLPDEPENIDDVGEFYDDDFWCTDDEDGEGGGGD